MRYLPLLLVVCLFYACAEDDTTATQNFQKGNISFQYAGDWEVTGQDSVNEGITTFEIEKKGVAASGLVNLTVFNAPIDEQKSIQLYMNSMRDVSFDYADFSEVAAGSYGNHTGLKSTYKLDLLGVSHTGAIYAFNNCRQGFVVLEQGADEDVESNTEGFRAIAESLLCE